MSQNRTPEKWLLAALVGLGVILMLTSIEGVFTTDEDNYLVGVLGLRQGRLTVPGTEGLPPSRELLYFDPMDRWRLVSSTPVSPVAPPLYSFLALPFSYAGWRGLILVNVLSFLGTIFLIFQIVKRYAKSTHAPWLAAGAFSLGSFGLEYAQGVWPHMLAVFLCTAAFALVGKVREHGQLPLLIGAGFLVGLAAGVRYQNAFLAGCLGLALLLFSKRRVLACFFYGIGFAVPLSISALINFLRIGSWNPISKGPSYIGVKTFTRSNAVASLTEPLYVFWAKVVDMSAHPALSKSMALDHAYAAKDAVSGAFLVLGDLTKKALLQSMPWVSLSLIAMVLAMITIRNRSSSKCELRFAAMLVFPVLFMFAAAGFVRFDGVCFNQRYFMELLPLACISLALALDEFSIKRSSFLAGILSAIILAGITFLMLEWQAKFFAILKVPLAISALLLIAWIVWRFRGQTIYLSYMLGMALAWSFAVHLLEDIPASRGVRSMHRLNSEAIRPLLKERSAILACSGRKIGFGILQLDHDLVIVDCCADKGKASFVTTKALLKQGRQVLMVANSFPSTFRQQFTSKFATKEQIISIGPGWEDLQVLEVTNTEMQ